MSFLAPGFLLAAAAAAALTVGLHFLVTRHPRARVLPTARFVPASPTAILAIERRPYNLPLLVLRVLLIALVGAAFARPHWVIRRSSILRLVVADRSRAVADVGEVRDSARRLVRPGDVLILFDSAASVVGTARAADSLSGLARSPSRGALSAALVAAGREAGRHREEADSLELDVVSPLRAEEADSATLAIRALWRGRIRLVPVAGSRERAPSIVVAMRGADDDPLRYAGPMRAGATAGSRNAAGRTTAPLAESGGDTARVLVVRDVVTGSDSLWVRSGAGRTLVVWPAENARPSWPSRSRTDTVGAVVTFRPEPTAVVARWPRPWTADTGAGSVVARWEDGEAAAVERRSGRGCMRDVAIPVNGTGDLVLRPAFARLVQALIAPCVVAGPVDATPLGADATAAVAGRGGLAATVDVTPSTAHAEPVAPWLLGLAIAAAMLELVLRVAGSRPAVVQGAGRNQ